MTTAQAGVQADAAPVRIQTSSDSSAAIGGRSAGSGGATSGAEAPPVKAPAASSAGSSGSASVAGMQGVSAGEGGQPAKSANGFVCPAGPFPAPVPADASATRIAGIPVLDAFNDNGNTRTNIEGPVWIDGTLYVSEFQFQPAPTSRILALELATGKVSVAAMDVGTNGLAVDMSGALIATDHKQGAIVRMRFPLSMGMAEVLTSGWSGKRFNSPNDLAVRSDGTIYFSDPDYQAPSMHPQDKTRAYSLPPASKPPSDPMVIDETRSEPNGVTLSPDERTLYIAGSDGVFSYSVQPDGSVKPGSGTRLNAYNGGADGMGMDCAGNLYIAAPQRVVVLSADGMEIGGIAMDQAESVTNVAFGGPERKTLFITSMGTGDKRGVFRVELNVPGFPY